jgi:hypothetical protein
MRSIGFEANSRCLFHLLLTGALDAPQWRKLPFTISAPFQQGAPPPGRVLANDHAYLANA